MKNKKIIVFLLLALLIQSCGINQSSKLSSDGSLSPEPADKKTLEARASRYLNQTDFVNIQNNRHFTFRRSLGLESAADVKTASGAQREIEESDIFKIDNENKILYLLNDYRGLQVISYKNGINAPELIGRAPASGNYPKDMFFYNNKIVVVENNWFDQVGGQYRSSQSRVVVFELQKDLTTMKELNSFNLTGELVDQRRVGDILYLATNDWNYSNFSSFGWQSNNSSENSSIGRVYSVNLATNKLNESTTSKPLSQNEIMGVVEAKNSKGGWSYYITAVLSDSRWGWNDTRSSVEVIDISDAEGQIKHVMVANPQGLIEERSQVTIKDNTLITATNYMPQVNDAKQRLAVETFLFPKSNSKKIDEEEADYRQKHIARAARLNKFVFNSPEYNQLLDDDKTGLRNVFVKNENTLTKLVSDSFNSAGDTNGLHAVIRDVRVKEDQLYVFWVPSDRARLFNDPLEVYDIKDVKDIKHLYHLEFEGRIDRSFPITHNGKDYILALGVVEPANNNENRTEKTQLMVIELQKRGNKLIAFVADRVELNTPNTRPNLQGHDKLVNLIMQDKDNGFVLFEASANNGSWWSRGGRSVFFNLANIEKGEPVFSEGAFIPAVEGYLKRVFFNSSIDGINSFTNNALAAFEINNDNSSFVAPASVLELSRNIRGYVTLDSINDNKQTGLQIVSNNSYYTQDENEFTEIRAVDPKKADSELNQVLESFKLDGGYQAHILTSDNKLLIATTTYKYQADNNGYRQKVPDSLNIYSVYSDKTGIKVSEPRILDKSQEIGGSFYTWGTFKEINGELYHQISNYNHDTDNYEMFIKRISINTDNSIGVEKLKINCELDDDHNFPDLNIKNGFVYLEASKYETDKSTKLSYTSNYIRPVSLGAQELSCGKPVNIPGSLAYISNDKKTIVTQDTNLSVLFKNNQSRTEESSSDTTPINLNTLDSGDDESTEDYRVYTKSNIVVLALDLAKGVATLKNLDKLSENNQTKLNIINDSIVYVESIGDEDNNFFPGPRTGFGRPFMPRSSDKVFALTSLSIDKNYNLIRTAKHLPSVKGLNYSPSIASVLNLESNDKLLLITQGNYFSALNLSSSTGEVKTVPVSLVKPSFGFDSKGASHVQIVSPYAFSNYSYYGYESASSKANFNRSLNSIEAAADNFGVIQIMLLAE